MGTASTIEKPPSLKFKSFMIRGLRRLLEPGLKDTALGFRMRRFPEALLRTLDGVGVLSLMKRCLSEEKYLRFLTLLNPFAAHSPGRLFLEKMMVRFRDRNGGGVLIIGFNQANIHYTYYYTGNGNFVYLLDIKKTSLQFQGRGKGIIGSIAEPGTLPNEKFALVDFNGVYGVGVNSEAQLRQSLDAIHHVLVPNGTLLFGHSLREDPLNLAETYSSHFYGFEEIVDAQLPFRQKHQICRAFRRTTTPRNAG